MSSALLNDEIARRRAEDELLSQDDDQSDQSDQSDQESVTEPLVTEEPQQEDQPQQEQIPEERQPETPEQPQPETPEQPQPEQPQPEQQVQPPKQQEAGDLTALQRYNDAGLSNFEPEKKEEPQVTEPKAEDNAEPAITEQASTYRPYDGTRQIQGIVLHSSDGNASSDIPTLTGQDPNHQVSAHYYVTTDGTVHHFVADNDVAWHAGATTGPLSYLNNNTTIGIEQEHVDGTPWKDSEVQGTAKLVASLMKRYNLTFDQVVGHSDIAPERKQDPLNFPWTTFRRYVNDNLTGAAPPQITGQPSQIQAKAAPTTLAEYNDNGLANFEEGPQPTIDEKGNISPVVVSADVQRARPAGLQDNGFYQGEDPKDFVSGGVHTFGGAQDRANYLQAKQAGATEAEALAVGDNGVGAPRLGSIDTSSAIGLAIPLDAVKAALGDKPTNWRTARVDVVGPNGVRLRLPIVDFGPRDTANTAADLTENAAKLFKTTDGKFSFKIVPNAGPDIEKDPDAYKKEQILLSQGIDPGSQGTEHATFPTTTGPTLTADQLALRDKALAQDQQDQKDAISKLPEFTSGSIPGLIKRLEGDEPIPGVSDGMRQAYADSLKQSATAYAQSYYGIKDPDEAYKKIMSDADAGTVLGDLAKKSFAKLGALGNSIGAQQQIVDENRTSDFFNLINPNATPERKAAVLNYLKGLDPEQRRLVVAKMYSSLDPQLTAGMSLDDLQTGLDRISDPKYQAARTQAIANDKAQTEKLLQSDPRLKGTTSEAIIDRLSELPKMGLEIGSGWIGRSMIASDIYAGALESAKQDHPDWTEEQQRARATASTMWQLLPAEALTMLAGQQLPGVSTAISKIENPVQRLLASTLTHTGIGGGAMTLQSLGRNIAEGKPLDTGLVESFLTGAVLGAPGGVIGGLRGPTEEVPRGTEVTPPVEAPKPEVTPVKPSDVLGPERSEEHPWYSPPPIVSRLQPQAQWTPETLRAAVEAIPDTLTPEEFQQAVENLTPPATQRQAVWQPEEPSILVTREDANRRAFEISQQREDAQIEGNRYDDYLAAQRELASAKKPLASVTQGESEPWVSAIANRFTAERTARGELGEIAPGQGVSTEALVAKGLKMGPEEIAQHVSDIMNNVNRGNPVLQASAIRAKEAELHARSENASRVAEANPTNQAAWDAARDAFDDYTDFHNGPVAKLKNNWHQMGMSMQGEIPVDLSTMNGLKEAFLKDVGRPPDASVEPLLQKTAQQIRDAAAAEKESMAKLGAKIDEYTAGKQLPSDEEVRNNIIDRMKVEPCSV